MFHAEMSKKISVAKGPIIRSAIEISIEAGKCMRETIFEGVKRFSQVTG